MDEYNRRVDLARKADALLRQEMLVDLYIAGTFHQVISLSLNDDTFEVLFAEGGNGWFLYDALHGFRARSRPTTGLRLGVQGE